jgi:hypothetical protein
MNHIQHKSERWQSTQRHTVSKIWAQRWRQATTQANERRQATTMVLCSTMANSTTTCQRRTAKRKLVQVQHP